MNNRHAHVYLHFTALYPVDTIRVVTFQPYNNGKLGYTAYGEVIDTALGNCVGGIKFHGARFGSAAIGRRFGVGGGDTVYVQPYADSGIYPLEDVAHQYLPFVTHLVYGTCVVEVEGVGDMVSAVVGAVDVVHVVGKVFFRDVGYRLIYLRVQHGRGVGQVFMFRKGKAVFYHLVLVHVDGKATRYHIHRRNGVYRGEEDGTCNRQNGEEPFSEYIPI